MQDDPNERDGQSKQLLMMMALAGLLAVSFFLFPSTPSTPSKAPEAQTDAANSGNPLPPDSAAGGSSATPPQAVSGPQAGLPPSAETTETTDSIVLENKAIRAEFTRVGARLKKVTVVTGTHEHDTQQLVPWDDRPDAQAIYPLGLRFPASFLGESLDSRRWEARVDEANQSVTFTLVAAGLAQIEKTFRLSETPFVLDASIKYTNASTAPQLLGTDTGEPAFSLTWGPNIDSGDKDKYMTQQELLLRKGGNNIRTLTSKLAWPASGLNYSTSESGIDWMAVTSCYYVVAMKPEFDGANGWALSQAVDKSRYLQVGLGAPRAEVAAGASIDRGYKVYLGPRLGEALNPAWPKLDSVLETFTVWGFTPLARFMNWFALFMLRIMTWSYQVVPNYGLAIIVVTLLVRTATLPFMLKSTKSMKKMQKLQPEIEKIKEEVGEDQQEMQRRMMQLYRDHGASPLGGCLPIFLQLPVFIAFYRMLANAFELRGAPFGLWITDLSQPDSLVKFSHSFNLIFFQLDGIHLLPILGGIAMVLSSKLTPTAGPTQNPQQKMMMTFMPIFFSAVCYNMAAALNLYILVSTLFGIGQSYLVHVTDEDLKAVSKKTPASTRPKHFYAAAHARKREAEREARREKRQTQTKPRPDAKNDKTGRKED